MNHYMSIHWYDDHKWVQRLRGCYTSNPSRYPAVYSFPMEEVLYQLLLNAKLDYLEDSLAHLHILWERYHREHPDFNISVELLIEDGWIDSFCGRWSLIGHYRDEPLDEIADIHLRGILEFLRWLPTQINEYCSPLYLEDWGQELSRLREIYPTLPETEWFIQEQILHADGKHFCHMGYGPRNRNFFMAFARLWLTANTPEQKKRWAELAHQLGATACLLDYLPREHISEAVGLLAERFLDGDIPNTTIENRRVCRSYMFQRKQFQSTIDLPNILREEDCVENLRTVEHRGWESFSMEWHRNMFRYFELSAVIDHIVQVPADLRGAVLARIQSLHEIGFLSTVQPVEAASVIYLLQYPQTQFAAMHTLIMLHREQSHTGNQTAGDCLLAWLTFALRQRELQQPDSVSLALLYLSEYAYRGTGTANPENELLEAVLQLLSRYQIQRPEFLCDLSSQLVQKLDAAKGITWCRRFQLVSQVTQAFSKASPGESLRDASPCSILFDGLRRNLRRLLCTPFTDAANYISSAVFEYGFWPELYSVSNNSDRVWMRDPVLSWYRGTAPDTQQQFNARHQFQLGLAWLTALKKAIPEDSTVCRVFAQMLCFSLEPHNRLLTIEWVWPAGGCPELAEAVKLLKSTGMDGLLEQLCGIRSSELILLIQYAADESVRKLFLDELMLRINDGKSDALDQIGWDRLVQYILEQKIEPLYDTCEQHLKAYLERICGKKGGYGHVIGDQEHCMLSYIWLLRGEYERLFEKGHPYMQAVARLEEGPYQDLRDAAQRWEKLSERSQDPSAYQNLLLSYLRMLEKELPSNEQTRIIQHIDTLRLKIEDKLLRVWQKEDQMRYADELIYYFRMTGDSENQALQKAAAAIHSSEEILAKRIAPEEISLAPQPQTLSEQSADQLVLALRQFYAMPLQKKSRCFFESRSNAVPGQAGLALILWEIFRTLYHLCAFGDKLLAKDKLYEDRCTQLFRELFNLNCGEWWKITANDQQQMGSTGAILFGGIHSSAEIDLLIQEDGSVLVIDEALVLTGLDKEYLREHLDKLIGNNIQNVPMVLMIYGNSMQTADTWQKVQDYLRAEYIDEARKRKIQMEPFHRFVDSPFYLHDEYYKLKPLAEQALVTYVSHSGGEKLPLFIIFADVGKRGHFDISAQARKKVKGSVRGNRSVS